MGSYTTVRKGIVDTEIAMYQSTGTVIIIDTITIAPRTVVLTTAMQMLLLLLKLTVYEEQEGGLRN
jgi:hypothetical protein